MSAFTFGARLLAAATLAFAFVAAGVPAAAQTTGQIKGKVVDGKGQPVDKAAVTIEFKGGTNLKREVKTNKKGEFIQVGLQPGPYSSRSRHEAGVAADQVQVGLGTAPEMSLTLKPAATGMSPEEAAFRKTFDEGVQAMGAKNHDAAIAKFNEAIGMQADCYACYMNVGSPALREEGKRQGRGRVQEGRRTEARRRAAGPDAGRPVQQHGPPRGSGGDGDQGRLHGRGRRRRFGPGQLQPGRDPVERRQDRRGQGAVRGRREGRSELRGRQLLGRHGQPQWRQHGRGRRSTSRTT